MIQDNRILRQRKKCANERNKFEVGGKSESHATSSAFSRYRTEEERVRNFLGFITRRRSEN